MALTHKVMITRMLGLHGESLPREPCDESVMIVEVSAIHLLIQEVFIEHLLHARSSARCWTSFKDLTVSMRHSSALDKGVLCSGSLQVLPLHRAKSP